MLHPVIVTFLRRNVVGNPFPGRSETNMKLQLEHSKFSYTNDFELCLWVAGEHGFWLKFGDELYFLVLVRRDKWSKCREIAQATWTQAKVQRYDNGRKPIWKKNRGQKVELSWVSKLIITMKMIQYKSISFRPRQPGLIHTPTFDQLYHSRHSLHTVSSYYLLQECVSKLRPSPSPKGISFHRSQDAVLQK